MKLINRETDYAVRALSYMAERKEKIISVSELVEKLRIPRPFLRKILQILHKKGLLLSYKGRGGGFMLTHPSDKILLVDLIKIFQGPLKLNECLFKKRICADFNRCMLKRRIDAIEQRVVSELKSITLKSLINGQV